MTMSGEADAGSDPGRRRLLAAMRPSVTRAQLLAGLLCAVLGFALVAQVRQTQTASLPTLRQGDLIGLLQRTTTRSSQLEEEARQLQAQLTELQTGSDRAAVAKKVTSAQLEVFRVLAGTVAATGPGIQLDIADPNRAVSAAMLLDAIQELRGAGAEAIQVGPVRVVAETAFVDDAGGNGIRIDGVVLRPPYRVLAIGDSSSLDRALSIPGGILEGLSARQADGTIQKLPTVEVVARATPRTPLYARPVTPAATP
ncbi:MAG: DUF881 domain-containing protein [Kineosporiaceae bacterium]|jgi:uncharacterized protein YlxW (UPF0749 family)